MVAAFIIIIIVVVVRSSGTFEQKAESATFALTMLSAGTGKPDAMDKVGACYLNGEGIGRNYQEAASWFRKAVEKSYAPSARNLAHMFRQGLGVERNLETAAYWYQRAAALGDIGARDDLAELTLELRRQQEQQQRQDDFRRYEQRE